ncbi:hypothetical protein K439DRAFT_1639791 [Ramaria rubella]|nr:hypothetical protein K439DRAFT_1639791 [Ramaria rubella]
MGKVRVFYVPRKYQPVLKLFQDVLKHDSKCVPDPRIGISLYLRALWNREKAKAAWKSGLDVIPDKRPAQLLLSLKLLIGSIKTGIALRLVAFRLLKWTISSSKKPSIRNAVLCTVH